VTSKDAVLAGHRALPDDVTLVERLGSVLGRHGRPVELLARRRVGDRATFPNEAVTVAAGGKARTVFCKYGSGDGHPVFGHRGGVRYEARVYRDVLECVTTRTVGYVGHHHDDGSGDTSLFLEYLEGAAPYAWSATSRDAVLAATWLGRFHRETARLPPTSAFLCRYDRVYYDGWAERTLGYTEPLRRSQSWIPAACRGFVELVDVLLAAPAVVLHGEYYAKNVLVAHGAAYPVDWESAAVGAGEIDLAAATDGFWEPALVAAAEATYAAARWPEGPPDNFRRRLAVARLYTQFRWLGDRPEWTVSPRLEWRLDRARRAAHALDLL
jgi:hypothetical protein